MKSTYSELIHEGGRVYFIYVIQMENQLWHLRSSVKSRNCDKDNGVWHIKYKNPVTLK